MALSMYAASIPVLRRMLVNLSHLLGMAADQANTKGIADEVLTGARLFPDMFALARQVQIATDQAKGCAARLAGIEAPVFVDDETTFAELQRRIVNTIAVLDSVSPAQIDGSETREIRLTVRDIPLVFTGQDYLLTWVFPNFYFHMTTAYNILRHNGISIGKRDFLAGGGMPD